MVSHHEGHCLAELYLVSIEAIDVNVDDNAEEDDEYERAIVHQKDAFWDEGVDTDGSKSDGDEHVESERVGGSGGVEDEGNRDDEPGRGETEKGVSDGEPHMDAYVEELRWEDDVDDADSEDCCPSDVLRSPIDGDVEDISNRPNVTKRVQFTKEDLINPVLQVGHIFADANLFRKAMKHANILKGKDLEFKRNETKKIIAVCKDKRCKYRVYGKKLVDESTFLLVSLYPKHSCTRRYKNHMINSAWIVEWCMESFRN
jgi:hypothetical protein